MRSARKAGFREDCLSDPNFDRRIKRRSSIGGRPHLQPAPDSLHHTLAHGALMQGLAVEQQMSEIVTSKFVCNIQTQDFAAYIGARGA